MLNKVNWEKQDAVWDRLLMSGKKIYTKNKSIATDVLCYMLGERHSSERETELLSRYKALFPESQQKKVSLPAKVK